MEEEGNPDYNLWWHVSASRYEIAIVIVLENFNDRTKFPGNFYLDSEKFSEEKKHDKLCFPDNIFRKASFIAIVLLNYHDSYLTSRVTIIICSSKVNKTFL